MTVALLTAGSAVLATPPLSAEPFELMHFSSFGPHVYRASSTLEADYHHELGTYGMHTLFDGSTHTGWSEGTAGSGIGESLFMQIPLDSDTLLIRNGFARSPSLHTANNRIQSLEASLWAGYYLDGMITEFGPLYVITPLNMHFSSQHNPYTLQLRDTIELQQIWLEHSTESIDEQLATLQPQVLEFASSHGLPTRIADRYLLLKLEIRSVYPGNRWDDTCLSQLSAFSQTGFRAASVYERDGALYYDTANANGFTLYSDRIYHYDPYLFSDCGRWLVAFQMPAIIEGRAETSYTLFHLPYPEIQYNPQFNRHLESGRIPVEFVTRNGSTSLAFDDGTILALP